MKYLVYISGPISTGGGEPSKNIFKATLVAKALMKAGIAVICPQWSGFTMMPTAAWPNEGDLERSLGCSHATWLEQDKRIIDACDAVYRMPGDSKGADIEVDYAHDKAIPVIYELDALYTTFAGITYSSLTREEMRWLQGYLNERAVYNKHGDPAGSGKASVEDKKKELGPGDLDFSAPPARWPDFIPAASEAETTGPPFDEYGKGVSYSASGYQSVTGGIKDGQDGRGDYSLLPLEPLRQVAEHLRVSCEKKDEQGRPKYARNNWRQGLGLRRIVSALRRHAFQLGESNTDEKGTPEYHLASILAEACFACQIIKDIKDGKLPATLDDVDGPFKALTWPMY